MRKLREDAINANWSRFSFLSYLTFSVLHLHSRKEILAQETNFTDRDHWSKGAFPIFMYFLSVVFLFFSLEKNLFFPDGGHYVKGIGVRASD